MQSPCLVLEDLSGEFAGAPTSAYIVESLRQGSAWKQLDIVIGRSTWAKGLGNNVNDCIQVLSGGQIEPVDIDELKDALCEGLGPEVDIDIKHYMNDGVGVCFIKVKKVA